MGKEDQKSAIRASVGPKVLTHADRYFTNDIATIAIELLQNARRAGASRVHVRRDTLGTITVMDNGRGLARGDVPRLLEFGGSNNDQTTEHDEAPGGMGFFSLARRGAQVRSGDWRLTISSEAFTGLRDADLEVGLPWIRGTRVSFSGSSSALDREDKTETFAAFEAAGRAMPFSLVVDQVEVQRFQPFDLIRQADGRPAYDDMVERRVGDCSVVVARFVDGKRRREGPRPTGQVRRSSEQGWLTVAVDVFGHVIKIEPENLGRLFHALGTPAEGVLWSPTDRGGRQVIAASTPGYVAVIEALGSRTIVPRLPDRRELVDGDGLREVGTAIAEMIATLVARAPRNAMPDTQALRMMGAALDGPIPPPQALLTAPQAMGNNMRDGSAIDEDGFAKPLARPRATYDNGADGFRDPSLPPVDDLVVLPSFGASFSTMLQTALVADDAPVGDYLVQASRRIADLDQVVKAVLYLDDRPINLFDGKDISDASIRRSWKQGGYPESGVIEVARLQLELRTRRGRMISFAPSFAVPSWSELGDDFVVVMTPAANDYEIVSALANVVPWYQAEAGDSWESQRRSFQAFAVMTLKEATSSAAQVIADKVADALFEPALQGVAEGRPSLRRVRVRVPRHGQTTVEVTLSDGTVGKARVVDEEVSPGKSLGRRRGAASASG